MGVYTDRARADWRFQRAYQYCQDFAGTQFEWRKGEDELVKALAQYWRRADMASSVVMQKLSNEFSTIHRACVMRKEGRGSIRFYIEAMAMGGAKPPHIAKRLGLGKHLVETYLKLFFDVGRPEIMQAKRGELYGFYTAFRHDMLADVGFKYIAACGGLDRFERICMDRQLMTDEDEVWMNKQGKRMRSVMTFSRSWEMLNADVFPAETVIQAVKLGIDDSRQIEGSGSVDVEMGQKYFTDSVTGSKILMDSILNTGMPGEEPRLLPSNG